MAVRIIGVSGNLVIHPGVTIAEILEDRNITQNELAASTGATPEYVGEVIAGKKNISVEFALALEHALGVPKSFWMNLQANYDTEMSEAGNNHTIKDKEHVLSNIFKYLRKGKQLPGRI